MTERAFVAGTFSAPPGRLERLSSALVEHIGAKARVLDLGCGTGAQLLDLARRLPDAELLGIDMSPANVALAEQRAEEASLGARVRFVSGDYLEYHAGPFDAIVCDSVLQNIEVADDVLYAKLARDLRPGGLLVATLPYACTYNRVLWCLRRVLRRVRGPALERAALLIGGRLHPDWDRAMIAERIPYLFMLPARVDDERLARDLAAKHGLVREAVRSLPHASIAQPKHRLSVFRRSAIP